MLITRGNHTVRYLYRNHGTTLILWDRWFGTFSAEVDIA